MDGITTMSAYIVWTCLTCTGENEWMESNRKGIVSLVQMYCVDGPVLMSGYIVRKFPMGIGDNKWTNWGKKCIVSILWMECVDVLV